MMAARAGLLLAFASGCGARAGVPPSSSVRADEPDAEPVDAAASGEPEPETASPPPRLACIVDSYPDAIARVDERDGALVLVFADGREAPWDDGLDKDSETRLESPDLEDTVVVPYPAGREATAPPEGVEPGRARHRALLENAYGRDERAVRARLVELAWPGGGQVRVTERNGAADALRAVISSLAALSDDARRCIREPIGSFSFRNIRGTDRPSPHAFGIAIDLNPVCGEYWRWQRPFEGEFRNRMPREVVDLFEAQGFIWGGRWHHYDTFHFEYRPELFAPACRAP
jgi:hypothetical protein